MSDYLKEACVENLMEAIEAYANGADQLELCASLVQDGLTPDYDLVQDVVEAVDIPVKVMIRSRGGHFIYTAEELDHMVAQLNALMNLPISGIVIGAVTTENTLDILAISRLAQTAAPLDVTIHKCIDEVADFKAAIAALKTIPNVKWILSSGTKNTAEEGKHILKEMMELASPEIQLLPAGKITSATVESLHTFLNAKIYHGRKIVD